MTKKKPEPKEISPVLFRTCRDWWIYYITTEIDDCYKFGSSSAIGEGEHKKIVNIEAKQFQNIIKRLVYRVRTKFGDIPEQELNDKVFQGLKIIVEFAHQNRYTVTAINIITKLDGIFQHIINENKSKSSSNGFNINAVADWYSRP